ncbi:hypothetical protein QQF64_018294 [Cirrhinus molitorella]|uniref:Apolipoprotein L3 n=1 Tax=Cirrhinus molitorella TaxID=172907 RepID=A0ABR3LCC2_9TELE
MASSSLHCRRKSMDEPLTLADVICLRDEFLELYERDVPRLRQCIIKLHNIIKTYEEDLRDATKTSRNAGVAGIAGASTVVAGLLLAPFTFGASVAVAGAGAATLVGAGVTSAISSFDKKHQMTQLRKEIEAELKDFQKRLTPMSEKMKNIHECLEKILSDLKKLDQEASDLSVYLDSTGKTHRIRREDFDELISQMSTITRLISELAVYFGGFSLFLDMISVMENNRVLDDIEILERTPIGEEIDEEEMKSKAGKFIVGMRKLVPKLQYVLDELEKTKDKMAVFQDIA